MKTVKKIQVRRSSSLRCFSSGVVGVGAAWGPVKRPDYARAEIRDPDGNPIELRQWHRR